ncbi:MAG TPA: hypothetical protein VIT92_00615 [Burkholderiaceae bacterium]
MNEFQRGDQVQRKRRKLIMIMTVNDPATYFQPKFDYGILCTWFKKGELQYKVIPAKDLQKYNPVPEPPIPF